MLESHSHLRMERYFMQCYLLRRTLCHHYTCNNKVKSWTCCAEVLLVKRMACKVAYMSAEID